MASNQNVNKVVYGNTTLIDLTGDDVTAASVLSGKKFHLKSGAAATGTIATKTASNLSANGKTVTVPAGYYASQATKDVATGSATAPASISGSSATVSTGTNTLTLTKTVSVTPSVSAGYVAAGTAGNSSVSLSASVTTKAAATITPTTSNQTIAAGTYLTGAQTIKGDANLVAGNIKSGVSIFDVTGSYAAAIQSSQVSYQNASAGNYVNVSTGKGGVSSLPLFCTSFVDVSAYDYIIYAKICGPATNLFAVGTAFFTTNAQSAFISGSGIGSESGVSEYQYKIAVVKKPATANYARFTGLSEVNGFSIIGLRIT